MTPANDSFDLIADEIEDAAPDLESESFSATETALRWVARIRRLVHGVRPAYLDDFGANNVPVEDLGAEPMGWEKAP